MITQNGVPTRLWAVIVRLAEHKTYLMMYLSPDSKGARYDGAFMDSAFSFRPLSADELPEAGQTRIKIIETKGLRQQKWLCRENGRGGGIFGGMVPSA